MPVIVNPNQLYPNTNDNTLDWGVTLRRFKRQPIDESSTHNSYQVLVDEMGREVSPIYKGQIVSVVNDDSDYISLTHIDEKTKKVTYTTYGKAPYYIGNNSNSKTSYYADRILTMSYFNDVESAYYVNKYQLGTYYTGVGAWSNLTYKDDNVHEVTGNTYAEIFNDYVTNTGLGAYSHVEGSGNTASSTASYSHVGGQGNTSTATYSLTTGHANSNSGAASIVGGNNVINSGEYAIVTGNNIVNVGDGSVVTGNTNVSYGSNAQISGHDNINGDKQITDSGENSNVIGHNNINVGNNNYINGHNNVSYNGTNNSIISGNNNVSYAAGTIISGSTNSNNASNSIVTGTTNNTNGDSSIVSGISNTVQSNTSSNIVSGNQNVINKTTDNSLVVGFKNNTTGDNVIIGGSSNSNLGANNFIAGTSNSATSENAINNNIVGSGNQISGFSNTVTGTGNSSQDNNSFIGGNSNESVGSGNIIVGNANENTGKYSAVGGELNVNKADDSVVFGKANNNSGRGSLVIGSSNASYIINPGTEFEQIPDGVILFGEGNHSYVPGSIIGGEYSDVKEDGNTLVAIGIGSDDSNRKNAFEIVHETEYADGNNATTYINGNGFTYTWCQELDDSGEPTGNTYGVPSLIINQAYLIAYGVNKCQLGTEYTGVGKWWYDETIPAYSNQLGTYGEIFNDYTYNRASGSYSHAEGLHTYALGNNSHVEGTYNIVQKRANSAHVEGSYNSAYSLGSHAEGAYTISNGVTSHSEGMTTYAGGLSSHAEGSYTYIDKSANYAHAEGRLTNAYGVASHVEGYKSYVGTLGDIDEGLSSNLGLGAHAEGIETFAYARGAHSEGNATVARYQYSHAEGNLSYAASTASHAEGNKTWAQGTASHAEGDKTYTNGNGSHAEGIETKAFGIASHTEGYQTASIIYDRDGNVEKSPKYAHAEGDKTLVGGDAAHSEGGSTIARGNYSHTEGFYTFTSDQASYGHTEGRLTSSYAESAHAEGTYTFAHSTYSHSEGYNTHAAGTATHVEGTNNFGTANSVHVEGDGNSAYAIASHAEGKQNVTNGGSSHAEGIGNRINSDGFAAHIEGEHNEIKAKGAHAEGFTNTTIGDYSHIEGAKNTISIGFADDTEHYPAYSHVEGYNNTDQARGAHIEGQSNKAFYLSSYSHIEGQYNNIYSLVGHGEGNKNTINENSPYSHIEGTENTITGSTNHVEGYDNLVKASYSHAEGVHSIIGNNTRYAHVEGENSYVSGEAAHAEGYKSLAYGDYSHAGGRQSYIVGSQAFGHGLGIHTYNNSEFAIGHWNRSYSVTEDRFYRSKYTHEWNPETRTYTSNGIWPGANIIGPGAGGTLFTIGDGSGDCKQEVSNNDSIAYRHNVLQINNDGSMLKNGTSYFNNDIWGPVSYTYVESIGISAYMTYLLYAMIEKPIYVRPVVGVGMRATATTATAGQLSTNSSIGQVIVTATQGTVNSAQSTVTSTKGLMAYFTCPTYTYFEVGQTITPYVTFRCAYVAPNLTDYDSIYSRELGNRLGYSEGVTKINYEVHTNGSGPRAMTSTTYTPGSQGSINYTNNRGQNRTLASTKGLTYMTLKKSTSPDIGIFSGELYHLDELGNEIKEYEGKSIATHTVSSYWAYRDSVEHKLTNQTLGTESTYTIFKLTAYEFAPSTQMYFQQLANKPTFTYTANVGLDPTDQVFADPGKTIVSYTSTSKIITWFACSRFRYFYGTGNTIPNINWTINNLTQTGTVKDGSNSTSSTNTKVAAGWFDSIEDKATGNVNHSSSNATKTYQPSLSASGSPKWMWLAIPSDGLGTSEDSTNLANMAAEIAATDAQANNGTSPIICRIVKRDGVAANNGSFWYYQTNAGTGVLDTTTTNNAGMVFRKITTKNTIAGTGVKYDIYYCGGSASIPTGTIYMQFKRLR